MNKSANSEIASASRCSAWGREQRLQGQPPARAEAWEEAWTEERGRA